MYTFPSVKTSIEHLLKGQRFEDDVEKFKRMDIRLAGVLFRSCDQLCDEWALVFAEKHIRSDGKYLWSFVEGIFVGYSPMTAESLKTLLTEAGISVPGGLVKEQLIEWLQIAH